MDREAIITFVLKVAVAIYLVVIPFMLFLILIAITDQTKYLKSDEEVQSIGDN